MEGEFAAEARYQTDAAPGKGAVLSSEIDTRPWSASIRAQAQATPSKRVGRPPSWRNHGLNQFEAVSQSKVPFKAVDEDSSFGPEDRIELDDAVGHSWAGTPREQIGAEGGEVDLNAAPVPRALRDDE